MKLEEWLKAEDKTQEEFGLLLVPTATQGRLSHWITGRHRIPLSYAVQVKRLTAGAVTEEDWIEPVESEGAAKPNLRTAAPETELVQAEA